MTAVIAIPLGIVAGFNPNGLLDRSTRAAAGLAVSIPNYYLAILLLLLFTVRLSLLPGYGFGTPAHLVLPVAVLVTAKIGYTMRVTRSTVLDILARDHVAYAAARGLSRRRLLAHHVFRNALVPIVTYLSLQFLMAVEGSIIVETIFAWPGIGQLLRDAVFGRDFTMIQGLVLFIGVAVTLVNLIVDIANILFNERLRESAGVA